MTTKKVCVIGAGITGISLANNLTQSDLEAVLIDRNPYPGGRTVHYGCKATDSCVHCGVCLARDAMVQLKGNSGPSTSLRTGVVGVPAPIMIVSVEAAVRPAASRNWT